MGTGRDLHPLVDQLLPLSSNMDRLSPPLNNEEDPEGEVQGISMARYADFGDDLSINYTRMYTTLSYLVLRERSSSLLASNEVQLRQSQQAHLADLLGIEAQYADEVERKRHMVDEINETRKKRQVDFQPVEEYLLQRWQDGVRSMVDLGIERAETPL